eukprot:2787915-Alexandrium_andersonii.AAC.1
MSASLVGSEMCIRDRRLHAGRVGPQGRGRTVSQSSGARGAAAAARSRGCLLYTSDAADDM